MKALIFSDSHQNGKNIQAAIEMHKNNLDLCIHLGDGTREFLLLAQEYSAIPFVYVHGNYEDAFAKGIDITRILDLEGYRVLLTHGHAYGVKGSSSILTYKAMEEECDIVLYGHTHQRENRYLSDTGLGRGMYIFNPGSVSRPNFGDYASCGLLEISKNGILLSHIKL
ncbi:MAG: metallophosphoesterase [Clostridia bacterium]|nr:metallophosphoesterase [Clostridia bacterium]